MSKKSLSIGLGLLAVVVLGGAVATQVAAAGPQVSETVTLEGSEVRNGPVTLAGYNVNLSQPIKGDVFILAQRARLSSRIEGDVTVLGRDVVLEGEVTGDVTVVAFALDVRAKVQGTASLLAMRLSTHGELATVYAASLGAEISGSAKSVWLTANQAILGGTIGDAHVRAPLTVVGVGANVSELHHVGRAEPVLREGASVGASDHRVVPYSAFGRYVGWQAYAAWFVSNILWLLGLSLVLWRFLKPMTAALTANFRSSIFGSTFTGLAVVLIGGSVALGLIGTRVGIHLAVVFFLLVLCAVHLGFVLFAWALGQVVARLLWRERTLSLAAVLVGVVLTAALLVAPVVGPALVFVIALIATGSLTRALLRGKLANKQHDRSQPSPR